MADQIPTIPVEEIPATVRELREQWAFELTRANRLERELAEARGALDAARKTCDDLTDHCVAQGKRIADLEENLAVHIEMADSWTQRAQANFARADRLAEYIDNERRENLIPLADIREIVESSGVKCSVCGGEGVVERFRDVMHGDIHSTEEWMERCDHCLDGRALR